MPFAEEGCQSRNSDKSIPLRRQFGAQHSTIAYLQLKSRLSWYGFEERKHVVRERREMSGPKRCLRDA